MTIKTFPDAPPSTLAGRFEHVMNLYAPMTEHEDGTIWADPAYGLISREDALRLLDEPHADSSGGSFPR